MTGVRVVIEVSADGALRMDAHGDPLQVIAALTLGLHQVTAQLGEKATAWSSSMCRAIRIAP